MAKLKQGKLYIPDQPTDIIRQAPTLEDFITACESVAHLLFVKTESDALVCVRDMSEPERLKEYRQMWRAGGRRP